MKYVIAALLALSSMHSFAGYVDGNQLKQWHDEKVKHESGRGAQTDYFSVGQDFGYVTGVVDSLDGIYFCPPLNVTKGQLTDIVAKYINKNPEMRNKLGSDLVVNALSPVFPCKK